MSPQPKQSKPEDEKPTAEELAKDRVTPEPEDGKLTFRVDDLRVRGAVILSTQTQTFTQPDVIAAFSGVPDSREITVTDARARVREWLRAPISSESA